MVELVQGLTVRALRDNLERVRERIAATGREPEDVQVLAAVKYLPDESLNLLSEAGITLVGENRAQQLLRRAPEHPELTFDFIGALQSRKVAQVLPRVRYIHSVASESALAQLGRHGGPDTKVMIEVNVAGEAG